jgi:ABC-type Mn2+/Zn2+ transport system ATPase subunit
MSDLSLQKKKEEQILGLLAELGRVVEELKKERLRELSGGNRGKKGRRH